MNRCTRILFVEDLPSDAELAVMELKKGGLRFEHTRVDTKSGFIRALKDFSPDIVISDYHMPSYNGLQTLKDTREFDPLLPFILFTGSVNEEVAVKCMKAGASDYVIKEHITRLPFAVKEALEQHRILTEKRTADLMLKESEEKIQSIFRAAPVGIGLVADRILIEVNDTLCKMVGYSRQELIGKHANMLYPSKEISDWVGINKYKQIVEKGTGSVETLFKCKDGNIINIKLSSTALDKNDLSKGITFTVLDITERIKAVETLKTSLSLLNASLESTVDGILITDGKGSIIKWNRKFAEMWELPERVLVWYDDNAAINFILDKLRDPGKFLSIVSELYANPDKSSFDILEFNNGRVFERYSQPQKIEQAVVGRVWSFRDVTQRNILEAATKASEQRYRELFLNNPVPTYIFDENTLEFIEVNDAAVQKYGYSKREFTSMTLKDIRLPEDVPGLIELIKSLRNDTFTTTILRHRKKDGSIFPVEVTSHALSSENGHKVRLVMATDITERVKAAEQMKLGKEKAEASDKMKTSFLNNISHELRTPLNGILGFAEIMSQTDLPEEDKKESLSMLHESSDRLLSTITNYMDISLITSGNMTVNRKDFFPGHILRRNFEYYETICSTRKLELILEIPEQTDKLLINSDPELFQKILAHLLNNAIKFTEKGRINFGYAFHDKEIEFFIKDTGIGIGKESIENVFNHFVKEDNGPLRPAEGSGLGLTISKSLVELLGGNLRVDSEKGKGSSFFFTIPRLKENKSNGSFEKEVIQKKNQKTNVILVAEDDITSFFCLKTILKQNTSAEIIHALNGQEAVDKYLQNPDIGLILMDIKMPVMDGLEATRQIKAINRDITVIALTAYAMAGDEARILEAGCDYYLTKPIDKKLFLAKLAQYIN